MRRIALACIDKRQSRRYWALVGDLLADRCGKCDAAGSSCCEKSEGSPSLLQLDKNSPVHEGEYP